MPQLRSRFIVPAKGLIRAAAPWWLPRFELHRDLERWRFQFVWMALPVAITSLAMMCGRAVLAIAPAGTRPNRFAREGRSAAAAGLVPVLSSGYVARHGRGGEGTACR